MNKKGVNIWLDDQRKAPEDWVHLHNIEEVENFIESVINIPDFRIDEMSFDFNLAHPKNGLDVMQYLAHICTKYGTKRFWPKKINYISNDARGVKLMTSFAEGFENKINLYGNGVVI